MTYMYVCIYIYIFDMALCFCEVLEAIGAADDWQAPPKIICGFYEPRQEFRAHSMVTS